MAHYGKSHVRDGLKSPEIARVNKVSRAEFHKHLENKWVERIQRNREISCLLMVAMTVAQCQVLPSVLDLLTVNSEHVEISVFALLCLPHYHVPVRSSPNAFKSAK